MKKLVLILGLITAVSFATPKVVKHPNNRNKHITKSSGGSTSLSSEKQTMTFMVQMSKKQPTNSVVTIKPTDKQLDEIRRTEAYNAQRKFFPGISEVSGYGVTVEVDSPDDEASEFVVNVSGDFEAK